MSDAQQLVETAKVLGMDEEALAERVVERIAGVVLGDDDRDPVSDRFAARMEEMIVEKIDAAVEKLADEHVGSRVEEMIDAVTLQETNKWGEAKGEPVTFREYLTHRAEIWLTEEVNFHGKSRAEDSYNWRGAKTRVAYMIHQHIDSHIKVAIRNALKTLNDQVAGGLEQTVKLQIKEVLGKLKVDVKA